jgi:hypothetical protein
MYSVGKALGTFWPGRDTRREPASWADGRENSVALQAPSVTRLCLQVWKRLCVAAEAAVDALVPWFYGLVASRR